MELGKKENRALLDKEREMIRIEDRRGRKHGLRNGSVPWNRLRLGFDESSVATDGHLVSTCPPFSSGCISHVFPRVLSRDREES